jgi:tRNA G18 (ribose-2'-O)-methylase SpoU
MLLPWYTMTVEKIANLDDTRIRAYRNLKDRQLAQDLGLFVGEGEHLVRRLLASELSVHSVLMTEARYASAAWTVDAPLYLASKEIISGIVGFDFHRGVLALGRRPAQLPFAQAWAEIEGITRLLVCPEINDAENLGSIIRSAAGLGFAHILLGPSCCDAWARRTIRTSMGAVFQLKLCRSSDLDQDLDCLAQDYGFKWHAAVLDKTAATLDSISPPPKVGLLLGSEANGLAAAWCARADQAVSIPMALETDSLNVGVAAGIFMHHYRER